MWLNILPQAQLGWTSQSLFRKFSKHGMVRGLVKISAVCFFSMNRVHIKLFAMNSLFDQMDINLNMLGLGVEHGFEARELALTLSQQEWMFGEGKCQVQRKMNGATSSATVEERTQIWHYFEQPLVVSVANS